MRSSLIVILLTVASTSALSGCGGAGSTVNPAPATGASRASVALRSGNAILSDRARNLVYVSDQLQKAVLAFPAGENSHNPGPVQTISFSVYPEGVWVDRHGNLYVGLFQQS